MERRKALTLAGSAAMVVAAGGIAMAANFGVLGVAGAGDGSVGTLDANTVSGLVEPTTTTADEPQVVYIDQYDVVPGEIPPAMGSDDDHSASNGEHESDEVSDDDRDRDDGRAPAPGASTPTPTAGPSPTVVTSRRESEDEHEDEPDDHYEDEDEHEDD
jgi:hypothetical protein